MSETRYDPRYEGEWLAFPLRKKSKFARTVYQRRPHFFPTGDQRSFCEIVNREEGMLLYDPAREITLQSDPLIDRIREHIRPCRTCEMLLAPPATMADVVREYQIEWVHRG